MRFSGNESTVQYISLGFFSLYPHSRGSIHITSADDVYAPSDFNAGTFTHPADIAPLIWAYKKFREIARRMVCFRGEIALTVGVLVR